MVGEHPVHVVEADRTLDDDKPTGIGRKPTGDELRDMDSEKLSRFEKLRKKGYEDADDVHDAVDKAADSLQGILARPKPTGHWEGTARPGIEMPQHDAGTAGDLVTGTIVAGVLAGEGIRWLRSRLTREKDA
jgi:hypothetical protein